MIDIQIIQRDSRQVCHEDTRISFAHFNQTQFFDGYLCDFSQNGVNFTSPEPLEKGVIVVLRFDRSSSGKPHTTGQQHIPRTLTLVQIRWCRPAVSMGKNSYDIGARFLRP